MTAAGDLSKVRYWPNVANAALVKIRSGAGIEPDYGLESSEQRKEDINAVDWNARIDSGWYLGDNIGIAIKLGPTINGKYGGYIVAIDIDGWQAVLAFFASEQNLREYAAKNRVEWHKDLTRLHLIFYTDRPLQNKVIHVSDGNQIEIKCNGMLLRVSPSVHQDGNEFCAMDSEQIPILKALELEAKIDSISQGYMSDQNKGEYIRYLENPNFRAHKGQRHNVILTMANSYFFRYTGEWANLSDDQRFEKLIKYDQDHCWEPLYETSEAEFRQIWADVVRKYTGQRQEERDKREEARGTTFEDMPRCISYEVNKAQHRFIIGTPDNRVTEIIKTYEPDDKRPGLFVEKISYLKTFTANKIVEATLHNNPLSFLDIPNEYTVRFQGSEPSGCFTLRHKTIQEIAAYEKSTNALTDRGIDYAVIAQIKGFEKAGLLKIDDDVGYTGFFPADNCKKIISSNLEIPPEYPNVTDALDFIQELETNRYVGRLELLAHTLKWFMIAPTSFIFKVIGAPLLEYMYPYGYPNTGKTTSGLIGLAFDGNENNQARDFEINMNHVDKIARFADAISDTTFPKIINEVDLAERDDIINWIVTAVDAVKFRKTMDRSRTAEHSPGLTPLFLTGNPDAPTRPEFVKRVKTRQSKAQEAHDPESDEAKEYKRWLASNLRRAHTLGQFRNKFVMENQGLILNTELMPFDKSLEIWRAIYGSVVRELPAFFELKLDGLLVSDSMHDQKGDIITALESWIIDKCRTLDTAAGERPDKDGYMVGEPKILEKYKESSTRLTQLIDKKLITCVKRHPANQEILVFFKQLVNDLRRYEPGLKKANLLTLADAIPEALHGKYYHGYVVVKCSITNLCKAFGEISEASEVSR